MRHPLQTKSHVISYHNTLPDRKYNVGGFIPPSESDTVELDSQGDAISESDSSMGNMNVPEDD